MSQAAVSYAYNRPEKLSTARRLHVLAVAEELGYPGPDPAGRSLRTRVVGAIGLMITDTLPYAFHDPATAALLQGISEVSELAEVALTLLPCPLDSLRVSKGSALLSRGAVDGFLAYALPEGHPGMATVARRGLPVVVVDGPDLSRLPRVGIDEEAAAAGAARHLLDLGHRDLGILVDRLHPDGRGGVVDAARRSGARDLVMRRRLEGYESAVGELGAAGVEPLVVEAGGFDDMSSQRAARQLLDHPGLTGVLAASDVLALAVLVEARRRGLAVPDQLSVVGFDDVPGAAAAGLTTVRQPLVEKGRVGATMLLDVISRRGAAADAAAATPPASRLLATELVVRSSTAAPSPHAERAARHGQDR